MPSFLIWGGRNMTLTDVWRSRIESWQGNDLTQAEYCRQQTINIKTFAARLSEYRHQQKADQAVLIPIIVDEAAKPAPEKIILHCSKGHRLELPGTVSLAWLSDLLRRLA
jgi:hypothetical protein